MQYTSLKSLFVISLHGMWFLDRMGRIKIRYGAKLGREGKEAVARLCHMEMEQEQTKGNLDYFWMSWRLCSIICPPSKIRGEPGETRNHMLKIHSEIEARGRKSCATLESLRAIYLPQCSFSVSVPTRGRYRASLTRHDSLL